MSSLRWHFQAGPLLARSVAKTESTNIHEWSAWQWAAQSAARVMERYRPIFQATVSGAVGTLVGLALPHFWLWRALLGAVAALATFWLIPTVWAVVAFFVAPVKQRNAARRDLTTTQGELTATKQATRDELTATKQEMEISLDLRDIAWHISEERIALREARVNKAEDQVDVPARIEWFRQMADTAAVKMEQSGLADRANEYRMRCDNDGRLLAPSAIDNGRLESLDELLSMMNRYQITLLGLVREYVGRMVTQR